MTYPHGGAASILRDQKGADGVVEQPQRPDGSPAQEGDAYNPPKAKLRDLLGLYEAILDGAKGVTGPEFELATVSADTRYFLIDGELFEPVASDGAYTSANGVQVSPVGDVRPENYRRVSTGYSPDEVEKAVARATSLGQKTVRVDTEYDQPLTIANRSHVKFMGRGSFTGTNRDTPNYRRQVIEELAPSARAFPDDNISIVMPKTGGRAVIVGDSLTTFNANMLVGSDGLTEQLERKLRKDNPDFNFNFHSRGIGATRFDELDSRPSSVSVANYPWYTDPNRDWLDYVEDLTPHVVFLSFGMNDKQSFSIDAFRSVVAKIEAWASPPQIVFITNMVPNLSAASPHGDFADQEGRDQVAGYVRTYANFHGYKCIDINRTFNLVRDGRDILQTALVPQPEITFGAPSEFIAADEQRCRDFAVEVTVPAAAFSNGSFPMAIKTGVNNSNTVHIDDAAGFVRFEYFGGGTGSLFKQTISSIPSPTEDSTWEFSVVGDTFTARLLPDGSNNAGVEVITQKIIRFGGLFRPAVDYFGGGETGPCLAVTLKIGVERAYQPLITDDELWGDTVDNIDGNGINHPTTKGAQIVYGTHFEANRYQMIEPFDVNNEPVHAVVDGTDGIPRGTVVDGSRLRAANAAGDGAAATLTAGTNWVCLGLAAGTTAAERTTTWRRIS